MEQNMHLLQLPADALACVLSHVPQQQRLGSCSLVSRSMHAAAVAATGELLQNRIATQQKADSLCAWLRRHGSKALKQLDLGADCLAYATPSIGVSLPRVGLLQLRSLTLSNVKLSQYVSYLAAATSQQQNSNTSLTTAAASAAQPGSRGAVGTAAAALVTAGALPLASLTGLTSFSATQCSTNRGSFLGWAIINLPSLTALRQLHLKGCTVAATAAAAAVAATEGSAEFGAMLAQLQQLTSLKLQGMRLDGTALVTLSRLSNLQQLQAGCVGSSAAPLQLQHLPASLTVLDISHCHVAPWVSSSSSRSRSRSSSSSSSSSILQLDNLQELNVSSADGFSPAFAATARQLRVFTLDANALPRTSGNANGVVAALSNLQQMRYLCLSSVGTQDVSAAVSCAGLTASSHLEELLLLDCQLPEGAQQHMFVAGKRLHQLTHLWWGRWAEAGGGYSASEKQKALRELSRSDCFAIGPGDAARMASCCPALRDLSSLWADSSVLCGELQCLVQLTALTRLTVGGSGWDDAAAEAVLAHMTGLCCVTVLHAKKLTVKGLACLTRLTNLSWLKVGYCGFPFTSDNNSVGNGGGDSAADAGDPEGADSSSAAGDSWEEEQQESDDVVYFTRTETPPDVWRQLQQKCSSSRAGLAALNQHAQQQLQQRKEQEQTLQHRQKQQERCLHEVQELARQQAQQLTAAQGLTTALEHQLALAHELE